MSLSGFILASRNFLVNKSVLSIPRSNFKDLALLLSGFKKVGDFSFREEFSAPPFLNNLKGAHLIIIPFELCMRS